MRTRKRLLSLLLCGALLFSLCSQTASAVSITKTGVESSGLCQHHTEHNADCGYDPATEGTPCGYVCEICSTEDVTPSDEAAMTVEQVQGLIDALPDAEGIIPDNRAAVEAQLAAIGEAWPELSDEDALQLDIARLKAAQDALAALDRQAGNDLPMPAAEGDVIYLYCDENGQNWATGTKQRSDYMVVTADDTTWGDDGNDGWYVASGTVTISDRVTVSGDVRLILENGADLTIKGGIQVQDDDQDPSNGSINKLTVYAQTTAWYKGKLAADATECEKAAGIGASDNRFPGGEVHIYGGRIIARGGKAIDENTGGGAGIGGGSAPSRSSAGGAVVIYGGEVEAVGGQGYAVVFPRPSGDSIGAGGAYQNSTSGTLTVYGGVLRDLSNDSGGGSIVLNGGILENIHIGNDQGTTVNGEVKILGNATFNGTVTIDGNDSSFTSTTVFYKAVNINGDSTSFFEATFKDAVTIAGKDSSFSGKTFFDKAVDINGDSTGFSGEATFRDTVTIAGKGSIFSGTGTTVFDKAVNINGGSTVFSDATFKDAVTIAGKDSIFSGTTVFDKAVDINGDSTSFSGNATFKDTVAISQSGFLANNGLITIPSSCTVTNGGSITNQNGAAILVSGVINNKATQPVGTITNNGTIKLSGGGKIIDLDSITGNPPVPAGIIDLPAGEIVIDLSQVDRSVEIGPKAYTIDEVSQPYDPEQNSIVLTGKYDGEHLDGSDIRNPLALVTVLENTNVSLILRDADIQWEKKNNVYNMPIWIKDGCTVTLFLEGESSLKPSSSFFSCIRTEETTILTVEGDGSLNLNLGNLDWTVGIGQNGVSGATDGKFGIININGGNFYVAGDSSNAQQSVGGTEGTVTINGGSFTGTVFSKLIVNYNKKCTLVINGGTINIDEQTNGGVALGVEGPVTINGGVIRVPGIQSYTPSVTVNGGHVTFDTLYTGQTDRLTINGGVVSILGETSPGDYKFATNGGSLQVPLTRNSLTTATSDGKTTYETVLSGQTGVASVLVDDVNQNISTAHEDGNLYFYLPHDEQDSSTDTHTVVVMYQDGSRKEYTANWNGTDSKFTFDGGTEKNPTQDSGIELELSGATVGEDGIPKKPYGDSSPVTITVTISQKTNAALRQNRPMLAASAPGYAFHTVILYCNDKEIDRRTVSAGQATVTFTLYTQAWKPGEYVFKATYGGNAEVGNAITTNAQKLTIVGQSLDEDKLDITYPTLTGTYGQKVSELTFTSGSVKQKGTATEITGTWTVTGNGDAVLNVGTTQTVTVTFQPTNIKYGPLDVEVTPTISPISLVDAQVVVRGGPFTYDGNPKNPTVTVTLGDKTLTEGTDYTPSYFNTNGGAGNHTNAGTVTVTVTGKGNYSGTATATGTFTINKANPNPDTPTGLTATYGQTLSDVTLPTGWEWDAPATSVGDVGNNSFSATYTPTDTSNYDTATATLTVTVKAVQEQFSLTPGGRYYFDLSAMDIPGTVNDNLPDGSLHWVPFTYVGTINAYSRNSEGVSTDGAVSPYNHSLFIADYNVTRSVSWIQLNEKQMIFGTPYTSYGVDYTMRAPSVGSHYTGSGDSERGTPQSNEWDKILDKDSDYIKNWSGMYSWGQDTYNKVASSRAIRGHGSARYWYYYTAANSYLNAGFRPVLEILNPGTLDPDELKVVTLDLGGGKLGNGSEDIQIIVKTGKDFAAPSGEGLTGPDGRRFKCWQGSDDKTYEAGNLIPSTVTSLTVQWTAQTYTVTLHTNGGTINNGDVTEYTYGVGATLPTAGNMTYTGHTFKGWYEDSSFSGEPVTTISATDTGNKTYYAKWEANTYTVTLNANGGTIADGKDVTSYTYGVDTKLPTAGDMTYTGHTFKGWYDNEGLTGEPVTAIGTDETGNRTYWAKWEANTYTVTLNANGGTINSGNITSYTYGVGATLPTADDMSYIGHTFKGWYEDSNFSGNPVAEISTTATGAKTYYAKWLSTDAGITAVSVDNTAGTINGTTITVVLPYGTVALPTENSKVSITAADGATVSNLTTTDGSEWTFTVTAADGQTAAGYTISVSIAPDPATGNRNDIAAAKSIVENHDWTVPQATANTEKAVKTWIEGQLAAMNLNGASYTVTMTGFTTATEGTAADRDGTNGSFTFTVKLYKGNDTGNIATSTYAEATVTISDGAVTATPYTKWTVTVNAGNGGSVSGGGTFEENTQVTVTATPNSGYHFVRWTENGAEVSTSASYSFTLTADRTLTAVFSRNSSGGYSYYTIKATAGAGGFISPSGNVSVREGRDQTFTITPDKGYAVANVKIDGKSIGAVKSYTFENVRRTHTIEVIFMKANGNPQTGVFVDVATGSYYEDAVDWAVEKGITNGVSSNMFAPNDPCTRAQIVTFLWRAAGSPAPKSMSSFTDVPADAFYAKAVAWAVENGITSGTGEGKFSPNATCTRAQSVTFLYRASGSPAVSGSAEFSDVSTTAFYADAVAWAAKKGITTGIGGGLFGSDNDCTRSQIVTFLWRCKK